MTETIGKNIQIWIFPIEKLYGNMLKYPYQDKGGT